MMKQIILAAALVGFNFLNAQVTDTLAPSMDNTLYEDANGSLSNGPFFLAGVTNQGEIRRGLLYFDIASDLPMNATIDSVELQIWSDKRRSGSASFNLHRVSQMWGEGPSATTGNHGQGTQAMIPDATWTEAMMGSFNPTPWANPGGDFSNTVSATQTLSVDNRSYSFKDSQLAADVQDMLDDPMNNFGWLMKADNENGNGSARLFNTKENGNGGSSHAPRLIVHYSVSSIGLDQDLQNDLTIFPNPGQNYVTIQRSNAASTSLEILDLTGRVILRDEIVSTEATFNTADLPKGVYILRVSMANGELSTTRWVKQ